MFSEMVPGLCLLLALCVGSATVQSLHVLDAESLMAGQLGPRPGTCDCFVCGLAVRPTR
jgi:hypothetical protein